MPHQGFMSRIFSGTQHCQLSAGDGGGDMVHCQILPLPWRFIYHLVHPRSCWTSHPRLQDSDGQLLQRLPCGPGRIEAWQVYYGAFGTGGTGGHISALPSDPPPLDPQQADVYHGAARKVGAVLDGLHSGGVLLSLQNCVHMGSPWTTWITTWSLGASAVPHWVNVGICCPFIPYWIELTQAQILFSCQMQNRDTEPNSKYFMKEYFNIAYNKHPRCI